MKKLASKGSSRAPVVATAQRSASARRTTRSVEAGHRPTVRRSSADKPLKIGEIEIPCSVLIDGRRIFTKRDFEDVLGIPEGCDMYGLIEFLSSLQEKGVDLEDLIVRLVNPIRFIPPHARKSADGYEATILPDFWSVIIKARMSGRLREHQEELARWCVALLRGLASVGIVALVDEVLKNQADRPEDDYARMLENLIPKELRG